MFILKYTCTHVTWCIRNLNTPHQGEGTLYMSTLHMPLHGQKELYCTCMCTIHAVYMRTYCTLCGESKALPCSAVSVVQHSLRGGARYTAWHMITVICTCSFSLSYTRTINELKLGKGHAVCDNGVVSIDHYCTCIQHFLPCNTCTCICMYVCLSI